MVVQSNDGAHVLGGIQRNCQQESGKVSENSKIMNS